MSHFSLIKAVQMEGLGGGGVVAPAFGDVQVTGVFDGRGDRGADGGQVGGPAAGPAGRGIFAECDITDMMVRLDGPDLPRAFRTADLWLIHAADCCSRYSSWTCCGV